jgi:hypothetical protein
MIWLSERAHRLLLHGGPARMAELAAALDCPLHRIECTLYNLRRKGRVTHNNGLWAAVGEPYHRRGDVACQKS